MNFQVMSNTTAADGCITEPAKSEAVVEARGIVKRFGHHVVVQQVSISCSPGEIVLLLGSNGAGKSTLLRMLAGVTTPEAGGVLLAPGVRRGFAGHHTCLYSRLSVAENLALYATLLGVSRARLTEMMQRWRLQDVQHKPVADISRGAQSKASLVRALMGDPHLLLLDEPSSNLDEEATAVLCALVGERVVAGGAVIIATHDLARLQALATRVVVMNRGLIIADSGSGAARTTIDSVINQYRKSNR